MSAGVREYRSSSVPLPDGARNVRSAARVKDGTGVVVPRATRAAQIAATWSHVPSLLSPFAHKPRKKERTPLSGGPRYRVIRKKAIQAGLFAA